jgi:hypothetical protein
MSKSQELFPPSMVAERDLELGRVRLTNGREVSARRVQHTGSLALVPPQRSELPGSAPLTAEYEAEREEYLRGFAQTD